MLTVIPDSADRLRTGILIFSYQFFKNEYKHKQFSGILKSKRQQKKINIIFTVIYNCLFGLTCPTFTTQDGTKIVSLLKPAEDRLSKKNGQDCSEFFFYLYLLNFLDFGILNMQKEVFGEWELSLDIKSIHAFIHNWKAIPVNMIVFIF